MDYLVVDDRLAFVVRPPYRGAVCRDGRTYLQRHRMFVTPAKAGVQDAWIPAFAGMTGGSSSRMCGSVSKVLSSDRMTVRKILLVDLLVELVWKGFMERQLAEKMLGVIAPRYAPGFIPHTLTMLERGEGRCLT